MLKIALTGGIASGKTTVANLFAQHGIAIIDTDIIAREVVLQNTPAWTEIVAYFGHDILLPDQHINRALLREKIFNSVDERKWLEALLHPLIRTKMLADMAQATSPYCIAVIPLLTTVSHEELFDRILVVLSNPALQIHRIVERDKITESQAKMILAAQISDTERLAFANDTIHNASDYSTLEEKVKTLHQLYLKLSSRQ